MKIEEDLTLQKYQYLNIPQNSIAKNTNLTFSPAKSLEMQLQTCKYCWPYNECSNSGI